MFKTYEVKNWMIPLAGLIALAQPVFADDAPPTGTTLSGGVDTAGSAITDLEDELAQHVSQTKFNATDYKAWNAQFRAKLNEEVTKYEQRLQNDIVNKLQPMTDRYQAILQDPGLRPDQVNALTSTQIVEFRNLAYSLTPAYRKIYTDLMKDMMGWLPQVELKLEDQEADHHILWNGFGWIRQIIGYATFCLTVPETWADYSDDCWANPENNGVIRHTEYAGNYTYTVAPISDSSVSKMQGSLKIDGDPDEQSRVEGSVTGLLSLVDTQATPSGQPSAIWTAFFAPAVKDGCQSQICLSLKETDLLFTIERLSARLDVPFSFSLGDRQTISIAAPSVDVRPDESYLSVPVSDDSLPFDTKAN